MKLANTVIGRRAVADRLSTFSKANGQSFDAVFRTDVDADDFKPQKPVETFIVPDGVQAAKKSLSGTDDRLLVLGVGMLCSAALADDDIAIEDVALTVIDEFTTFLQQDPRQGCPGIVINTYVGDAEINDSRHAGYFGAVLTVTLHIRRDLPDTF